MEQSSGRGFTPQNYHEITPLRRPRGAALSAEAPVFVPKMSAPPMIINDGGMSLQLQNLSISSQQQAPFMRQQQQQQPHQPPPPQSQQLQSVHQNYPNSYLHQQQNAHHLSHHHQQQPQGLHSHHHHQHYQYQQPQVQYHPLSQQQNRALVGNHHMQGVGGGGASGGAGAYPKVSVQSRLPNHQQSLNHQHHQLLNDDYMHNMMPSNDHKQTETESVALDFLTEVVMKLYDNPGMFEVYQTKLKQLFAELSNNYFVMSNAVELLFEQSISEQNFRYMGARLCNLLDDLDPSPDNQFRTLSRMKMTDQLQQLQQFMQNNEQHKVRGTTLFLAELYMQLRRANDTDRNVEIGHWIITAFQLLLSRYGPENVKCVCQSLKLCGFELDLDCTDEMKNILEQLKTFEDKIDISTGRLVRSILDLKGNRWGRSDTHSLPPVISELTHQEYSDSPVMYGPDGNIITEEESSFLASNIPQYPNINFDELVDDSDDVIDDGEMGLEIRMAFKEFLQSAKKENPK